MSVTATGIFKQPSMLAILLANSSTWQSLCGASSADDARRFISIDQLDLTTEDSVPRYPHAIAGWQDSDAFGREKQGNLYWVTTGTMTLMIELEVPPDYKKGSEDSHNWFMNQVANIVNEMENLAGQGEPITGETHLNATAFNRTDGPWRVNDDEMEILDPDNYVPKHVMWIVFTVEYV